MVGLVREEKSDVTGDTGECWLDSSSVIICVRLTSWLNHKGMTYWIECQQLPHCVPDLQLLC